MLILGFHGNTKRCTCETSRPEAAGLDAGDAQLPPKLPGKIEGIPKHVPLDHMKLPILLTRMRGASQSATEKLFGPLPVRLSLDLPSDKTMVMMETPKNSKEDVWFRSGWTMKDPKVHLAVGLRHLRTELEPEATALDSVRFHIYQKLLNEDMEPKLFDVTQAGSTYGFGVGFGGLTLDFVGYQDALPNLIKKVLTAFNSFNENINTTQTRRFKRIVGTYVEELMTHGGMPSSYASQDMERLLVRNTFSNEESLAAVKQLSSDQAVRTAGEFVLSKPLQMTALAIGNVADLQSTDAMREIASMVKRPSWVTPRPAPQNAAVEEVMPVVHVKRPVEVRSLNPRPGDPNDVAVVSIIYGVSDVPSRCILSLASSLLGTAAFDNLRTQQQLGYVARVSMSVGGGMTSVSNVLVMRVVVQGTKVDADEAEAAIEGLLSTTMPKILNDLSDDDFQRQVAALKQQLLEPPLAATDEVGHFWGHIMQGGRCMDLLDKILPFLDSPECNKKLLQQTWNNLVFDLQDYLDVLQSHRGGFSFENCKRNAYLASQVAIKPPTAMKNCEKLHFIAKNVYCAGAGTAADLQHTTEMMESQMELLRMATGTQPRVCTVICAACSICSIFYLIFCAGYVGCALVLGGVDVTGPHLFQIYPHGSTDKLPFTSMGSGSLAAMAILEAEYNENLSVEEGKKLVAKAIRAGIFNDLGSGSNVCVITKDVGGTILRNFEKPNERIFRAQHAPFPIGTTPIMKQEITKLVSVEEDVVKYFPSEAEKKAQKRITLEEAQKLWKKHDVSPKAMDLLAKEWDQTKVVAKSDSKARKELIEDGLRQKREGGYFPTDLHCGAVDPSDASHETVMRKVTKGVDQGDVMLHHQGGGKSRRSKTGLLPEQLGDICRLLWKDCDLIRSDEHHGNQVYCDVQSGIAEVVLAMEAAVSTTERPKLFIATLAADDPAEMIARGKHVLKAFGLFAPNCGFQLAGPLTSLGSLTALRRAFPSQFLHYHAAGAVAAHSAGSKRGYAAFVHAKLARILGASSVLVERKVDTAAEMGMTSCQDLPEIVSMLRDDASSGPVFEQGWEGMKQALPVVSGKLHALQLPFFFESVGHSEVLVTTEVSASKRDARPGFASLRAAEEGLLRMPKHGKTGIVCVARMTRPWQTTSLNVPGVGRPRDELPAMVRGKENWNTLNYSKQRLTDDDIAGLRLSQERRTFVEVDFSCNKLTSSGLEAIVKFCTQCPDLCVFKAFKNEIDDAGARHIATLLEKCKSIEEIHLSHNHLTAKGVRTIIRAADWKRHNTESPLWLRLEQNYVASGADFLRLMAQEHSVCGRNDDWRCTSRHCYWKRNIHVPFLHLQRQDWQDTAWTEDLGWEQTWKPSAQEQNRKAKTLTTQTAVSSQPKAAKMIEPVEELFRRHDEQWVSDEKGKQRWAVKQVEEPAIDWADSGKQVRAPVGPSKGSGAAQSSAKEPQSDKTKVEVKEEIKPPKTQEPKEPKQLPKDTKQKKTKEAKQDKKLMKPIATQVKEEEAPREAQREAPEAAVKDAKKKLKEPNDPKTSDEKEDAKAAKLAARTLLDAPKIHDGKIEQKWAKKGNKAPPPDVVTAAAEKIPMPVEVGLQHQESSQTESQTTVGGIEQDDSRQVSRSRKHSFQLQEAGLQADINLPPAPFLAPNFMEQNNGVDNSQVFAAEARLRKATNAKDCMVSKEDENQAEKFIQALNAIIKEDLDPERHCFAKLFGSMSTGFGTKGCDFDVVILSANTPESESTEDNKDVLMKLRKILLDKPDFEIKNVILTARVPILKLEYGGRDVDVSVNNEKALKNSRLLHAYAQLDPLIAEFGIAVKLWAKDAQLCGAKDGHLSSYAFILMALYFLQVGGDEMPSLQQGLDESWATADDDEALFKRVQIVKESWRLPTSNLTLKSLIATDDCSQLGAATLSAGPRIKRNHELLWQSFANQTLQAARTPLSRTFSIQTLATGGRFAFFQSPRGPNYLEWQTLADGRTAYHAFGTPLPHPFYMPLNQSRFAQQQCHETIAEPVFVYRGFVPQKFQYGHILMDVLPMVVHVLTEKPAAKIAIQLDPDSSVKRFMEWFLPELFGRLVFVPVETLAPSSNLYKQASFCCLSLRSWCGLVCKCPHSDEKLMKTDENGSWYCAQSIARCSQKFCA
eukprot:s876_g21.t1